MENKLNWLAFESGVLTPGFQKLHLVTHYFILALVLVLYSMGLVGVEAIAVACFPGAAWFAISLEALSWKMAVEGEDMTTALMRAYEVIR